MCIRDSDKRDWRWHLTSAFSQRLRKYTFTAVLLSLMTSLNVRVQISLGEIIPMTSRDSIAASANWTYIHTAQRCSLNPLNTFPTPTVKFTWIQRPRWRAIFGNTPILVIYPVIPCKLVSQAAVFCHVTQYHSPRKGGERGGRGRVVWRDKNGEMGDYL